MDHSSSLSLSISITCFALTHCFWIIPATWDHPVSEPLATCVLERPWITHYQRVLDYLQRTRLSFRRMIWLLSRPHPIIPHPSSESCLSFSVFLSVDGQAYWREWNDVEKAWSSLNHSILSAHLPCLSASDSLTICHCTIQLLSHPVSEWLPMPVSKSITILVTL